MIVGQELVKLLDAFYAENPHPLTIVETGCLRAMNADSEEGDGWSTLHIARWVKEHPLQIFVSVELNPESVSVCCKKLEMERLSYCVGFVHGDSAAVLRSFARPIDFAFLDTSDDPEHGLAEFKAAEEKGARMIVMDDVGVKTPLAEKYASENGWNVVINGRLAIMRR